ncbi:MAG: DNA mismatch repair protein MutH [Exiguobacterium chiriqhucha]|nr:MAG: DNA mismatch repair protein MutH [Exiguobacterium chiriqhucha]
MLLKFNSIDELLNKTSEIVGKTFKELDSNNYFDKSSNDKGILGKIVETGFYGYPNNNKAEADFDELGVELKVSGFTVTKKGLWSAKERISLSQINFKKIVDQEFQYSSLISKNRKILFIWYEFAKGGDPRDFVIRDYQLYDMTAIEPVIEKDYLIIQDFVRKGLAHNLSEGNSVILGAATKGASGQTQVQPYSSIKAKTRAFSIKNSFIKGVLKEHRANYELILPKELTPEEWLWNRLKKFKGMTQINILKTVDANSVKDTIPKGIGGMIQKRTIGDEEDLEKVELFNKLTYRIKSIPINPNYYPLEKATFKTLHKEEFQDEWDSSDWKLFFEESTFFYVGYVGEDKSIKNGHRKLECLFKVTFTPEEIESFEKTYNQIQFAIATNDISSLPTATRCPNSPLVISTKGGKGDSCYKTFMSGGRKTCFMFNKDFLFKKFQQSMMN